MRQSTWSPHLCEVMHPRIPCNSSEGSWDCDRWYMWHCLWHSEMCPHIYKSQMQTGGPEYEKRLLICHFLIKISDRFSKYYIEIRIIYYIIIILQKYYKLRFEGGYLGENRSTVLLYKVPVSQLTNQGLLEICYSYFIILYKLLEY